ncbi:MAG: flippase-like domain-containing protein [Chloroflexi bacterium]|nr:MAG: flippase-like domain-containing protein [Chloroflexota bacterium]
MGNRSPRLERNRELRRAADPSAADARLHRRLPLLQHPCPAVSRHPPAAVVWILCAGGAPDPLRARRPYHRRAAHHVHRPGARPVQDFAPGDLPGDGDGPPARRETQLTRRRGVQAAILLAVGLLILYGLLRTVHPSEVVAAMRRAAVGWIVLGELAYLGFILTRSWRWQVILRASAPHASLGDVTAVTAIGFALNSVSPFKLGELLRIGAIAPRVKIGVGEAGATVVVERVLDVLALLVIAVAAAAISGGGSNSFGLWSGVFVIAAISVAIGVVAYLMVTHPQATLAIIERMATRLPTRVATFVDTFAESVLKGFASLRSPGRLAAAGALSIVVWLWIVAGLIAFFRALTPQLSLSTLVLACTIFVVSQAVSITPGSVGTYEGFFLLVLSTFGARPPAVVTAVAVLSHVANIAILLAAGAVGALWLRVNRPALPVGLERPIPS